MVDNASREFELKLELDECELDGLKHSLAAGKLAAHQQFLKSTYFDTPDMRLQADGIALRIREKGGQLLQTVKLKTSVKGGISNPVEFEFPVNSGAPQIAAIENGKARKTLEKAIGGRELRPVFVTEIDRTTLVLENDGARAELALDKGKIVSGKKKAAICEAELELLSGGVDTFMEFAKQAFAEIPVRFGSQSKAERGYRLVASTKAEKPAPFKSWQADLKADMTIPEAFSLICGAAADQILRNRDALLVSDDPECAHQMRIGIRRLRAALHAFRSAIDSEDLRILDRSIRDLGRIVGETRDRDVLLADIAMPVLGRISDKDTARELEQILNEIAISERDAVRREMEQLSWNGVLFKLALISFGAGWQPPEEPANLVEFARKALEKSWKKAQKHARDLDRLNEEQRHRLRKDLKGLRYKAEFFASLFPAGRSRRFIERLRDLQDVFGYLNDVVLARRLPEVINADKAAKPAIASATGFIVGWHNAVSEQEWLQASERWKQLRKLPKFWT